MYVLIAEHTLPCGGNKEHLSICYFLYKFEMTGETQPPFHISIQVVLKSGIYVVMSLGLVHSLHAEQTTSGCTLCVLLS